MSADSLSTVSNSASSSLSTGQYYEFLQLQKSLINRCWTRKKWEEAAKHSYEGTKKLLENGQYAPGGELAIALIDSWKKGSFAVESNRLTIVSELAAGFFPSIAAPSASNSSSSSSSASLPLISFLRAALKWAESSADPAQARAPEIHYLLARFYVKQEEWDKASRNYLECFDASEANLKSFLSSPAFGSVSSSFSPVNEVTDFLARWSSHCQPSEKDLVLSRAVLQLLCLSDMKSANLLFRAAKLHPQFQSLFTASSSSTPASSSPLLNFTDFLLRTVERSAGPLFDILQMKYQLALSRDPKFKAYLEQIGSIYFGRAVQKGLLESLLEG